VNRFVDSLAQIILSLLSSGMVFLASHRKQIRTGEKPGENLVFRHREKFLICGFLDRVQTKLKFL